jgi:tagaturonate reductase
MRSRHAAAWNLEPEFTGWVSEHKWFLNTLVDRIVPGYHTRRPVPPNSSAEDRLLTTGEIFHISHRGRCEVAGELP